MLGRVRGLFAAGDSRVGGAPFADAGLDAAVVAKVEGRRRGAVAAGLPTEGWYRVSVPNTVVAALVEAKVYPDPYFGMNLRAIPGTTYPIGERFTLLPMPEDSPFRPAWWYRNGVRRAGVARRPQLLAALRRHQLPREHLAERHAHRRRQARWPAPSAATSST